MLSILFIAREYDNPLGAHKVIHLDTAKRLLASAAYDSNIEGYTVIESNGVWQGCNEQGFVVLVAGEKDQKNVSRFAEALRDSLSQEAVLFVTTKAEVLLI